ncbi:MAG: glycosylhydrolase-like jelly roll fold domain-containing protein [Bacteroidota bacterium]
MQSIFRKSIKLSSLRDWTKNDNPGIKYFSGTATYIKTFDLKATGIAGTKNNYLDLGKVNCIAKVKLNNKDTGVVLCNFHAILRQTFYSVIYFYIRIALIWDGAEA